MYCNTKTTVNGETAIKPYYYLRNGLLHIRYTVDRCVELSKSEEAEIKEAISKNPAGKMNILSDKWNLLTTMVERPIIMDGIAEADKRIGDYNGQ